MARRRVYRRRRRHRRMRIVSSGGRFGNLRYNKKGRAIPFYQTLPGGGLVGKSGTSFGSVARPFPYKLYTVLSYSEDFSLTNATAQIPVNYAFRGNGMYDPNYSGVGIQPRYFDTFLGTDGGTAPYSRYCVLASQITVKAFGRNGTAANNPNFNGLISITPLRGTASAPSTITEMRERELAKTLAVNSQGAWKPYTLKHYVRSKDILGLKDVQDENSAHGTYNSDPVMPWYWDISMCPVGASDTGMSFDFLVSVKYYILLDLIADVADS